MTPVLFIIEVAWAEVTEATKNNKIMKNRDFKPRLLENPKSRACLQPCVFLTGFKMLEAQTNDLFGPTDDKGKNSKKALYYDKIPDNVRSVGFRNTVLNSKVEKMKLFKELKLC